MMDITRLGDAFKKGGLRRCTDADKRAHWSRHLGFGAIFAIGLWRACIGAEDRKGEWKPRPRPRLPNWPEISHCFASFFTARAPALR